MISDSGGGDERGLNSRLFEGKSVSRDSRFLFVTTNPQSGSVGAFPSHSYLLQAVDLESGQASTVAQLNDPEGRVMGWDWLDETPVAPRF